MVGLMGEICPPNTRLSNSQYITLSEESCSKGLRPPLACLASHALMHTCGLGAELLITRSLI